MFIKLIPPGSQVFSEPVVQRIKMASDGLRGNDLKTLIKRAGHQFVDQFRHLKVARGDVPIHLLGIGATEYFGPNRNGDGWNEHWCQKNHPTFVKLGRWFRNHENKDKAKSYGIIKLSAYNQAMHRLELVPFLNGTKEAADRNGGLIADEEMQMLESGKDIPVSMAAKVPYDVCVGCGNKARTKADYCTGVDEGGHCKRGGVKNRLGMVHDDGFQNYVDNYDPAWFDMSKVWKPADRIAYVTGMMKAAAYGTVGGAALAEAMGVTAPYELYYDEPDSNAGSFIKLAMDLAAIEHDLATTSDKPSGLSAFCPEVQGPVDWVGHQAKVHEALAALTREKVAMPIEGFLELTTGQKPNTDLIDTLRWRLPGIYGRMAADGSLAKLASDNPFRDLDVLPPMWTRQWARKIAADYSMDPPAVRRRTQLATLRGEQLTARYPSNIKMAGAYEELARAYALYKLAFLQSHAEDPDFQALCDLVIQQNYS